MIHYDKVKYNDNTEPIIQSNITSFSDDTPLYVIIDAPNRSTIYLNTDQHWQQNWENRGQLFFIYKTASIIFTRNKAARRMQDVFMNTVAETDDYRYHVFFSKVSPIVNCLRSLKYRLQSNSLKTLPFYHYFMMVITSEIVSHRSKQCCYKN